MRREFWAVACLAALGPSAFAQGIDLAKLRQTIELPTVTASLGVHYRAQERDERGNKYDAIQKIADVQKKLTGGPDDASVYLDLHALYLENLRDEKKSREMALKAENVLRAHVQTEDGKLGYLLPLYATTLEILLDNPWTDCEKWARRAVSIAPQDWRTWAYLAHVRSQQLPLVFVGGDVKLLPKIGRAQEVLDALRTRRLRSEHVEAAEKVLNEAMKYHDKAKELAPNDGKRQEQRYAFRLTEIILRNAINSYRSEKIAHPMVQLDRVLLDELQTTARLKPAHLLWQSQLAHQLIHAGWHHHKDNQGRPAHAFGYARPEDSEAIREALGRIETLAAESKGETSTYCYSMLCALCSSMDDYAGAEKYARKILLADPKDQNAAEQLQVALLKLGRKADQLQAAQALVEANRTPRNCYLLAKALYNNQRADLAEQWCRAGLKLEATDVHCMLGLSSLMMKKGDAESMKLARELLDETRRALRPEAGMRLFLEFDYLVAMHQALSGDVTLARLKLERMAIDHPEVPRYQAAMTVLRP
ncbi:MAG: hypothetical protein FJ303_05440 [Planctomycetes bacterium]|nr:hypothetical protein [Planctomycetota bacterium]